MVGDALKKILRRAKSSNTGAYYTPNLKMAQARLIAGSIGMMMFDSMTDLSSECRRAYVLVCLGLSLVSQRSFTRPQLSAALMALITSFSFMECFLDSGTLNGQVHAMVHSFLRLFACGPLGKIPAG